MLLLWSRRYWRQFSSVSCKYTSNIIWRGAGWTVPLDVSRTAHVLTSRSKSTLLSPTLAEARTRVTANSLSDNTIATLRLLRGACARAGIRNSASSFHRPFAISRTRVHGSTIVVRINAIDTTCQLKILVENHILVEKHWHNTRRLSCGSWRRAFRWHTLCKPTTCLPPRQECQFAALRATLVFFSQKRALEC